MNLDKFDRQILEVLQEDGRISNQDLADRISLSPSPCLRRVRALEEAGIIAGYRAMLDANALGNADLIDFKLSQTRDVNFFQISFLLHANFAG